MTIEAIQTLISTLGVPVACMIAMGWYIVHTEKNRAAKDESYRSAAQERDASYQETIRTLMNQHAEESKATQEAYLKLSAAIDGLSDRLDKLDGGGKT